MFGSNKKITVPKSTQTCTSRYTGFQVLPVSLYSFSNYLSFSVYIEGGLYD